MKPVTRFFIEGIFYIVVELFYFCHLISIKFNIFLLLCKICLTRTQPFPFVYWLDYFMRGIIRLQSIQVFISSFHYQQYFITFIMCFHWTLEGGRNSLRAKLEHPPPLPHLATSIYGNLEIFSFRQKSLGLPYYRSPIFLKQLFNFFTDFHKSQAFLLRFTKILWVKISKLDFPSLSVK